MKKRKAEDGKPFHAVHLKKNGQHEAYAVYVNNNPFLLSANNDFPLKRHEAYAIANLLNGEQRSLKWAEKFSDPYA